MNKLAYYQGYMEKVSADWKNEGSLHGGAAKEMGRDVAGVGNFAAKQTLRHINPATLYRQLRRTLQGGSGGLKSGGKKGWDIGKKIGTPTGVLAGGLAGGYGGSRIAEEANMSDTAKLALMLGLGGAGAVAGGVAGRYGGGALGAVTGAGVGTGVGATKGFFKNAPAWQKK